MTRAASSEAILPGPGPVPRLFRGLLARVRWLRFCLFPAPELPLLPGERTRPTATGERSATGAMAERAALRRLVEDGCRILCRNRANNCGEIDIIALQRGALVFVEVRSRRQTSPILPEDTLNAAKRRTFARTVALFVRTHGLRHHPRRADFIAVEVDSAGREVAVRHHRAIALD